MRKIIVAGIVLVMGSVAAHAQGYYGDGGNDGYAPQAPSYGYQQPQYGYQQPQYGYQQPTYGYGYAHPRCHVVYTYYGPKRICPHY